MRLNRRSENRRRVKLFCSGKRCFPLKCSRTGCLASMHGIPAQVFMLLGYSWRNFNCLYCAALQGGDEISGASFVSLQELRWSYLLDIQQEKHSSSDISNEIYLLESYKELVKQIKDSMTFVLILKSKLLKISLLLLLIKFSK